MRSRALPCGVDCRAVRATDTFGIAIYTCDCMSRDHHYIIQEAPTMPDVNPKELRAAADGKDPLEYLEPLAEPSKARVMKHGAKKYGLRNYIDTPMKLSTYIGATRRHLNAIARGEEFDPDSGERHWAHVACCADVMIAAYEVDNVVNDREPNSTALSDRVHIEGDHDAKGLTAEYNRVESAAEAKSACDACLTPTTCAELRGLTATASACDDVTPFEVDATCCCGGDVDTGCKLVAREGWCGDMKVAGKRVCCTPDRQIDSYCTTVYDGQSGCIRGPQAQS